MPGGRMSARTGPSAPCATGSSNSEPTLSPEADAGPATIGRHLERDVWHCHWAPANNKDGVFERSAQPADDVFSRPLK
jgi:hypothetical protein